MPVTMRQVTGSKTPSSKFGVSIQQSLDGHSFSLPELERIPSSDEPVEVELLLPKTLLVPEGLFREETARELLAANGMPVGDDECCVVCKSEEPETVALAAIENRIRQKIADKFPQALFSTPLGHRPLETTRGVWICRRGTLLYVKVYSEGVLQLAEVIPAATEADASYFVGRLAALFPLAEYELRIAGDEPKKLRKWIGNTFKKVICES